MVSKKQSGKLPSGWTEHLSVKNDKTTKYYTNAETGQKFCSRQSLDRYLHSRGIVCEGKIPSVSTDSATSDYPTSNLAVVKMDKSPKWLPQGWIMESRKRGVSKHGSDNRVYIEKSTGCKFYSKQQVLQYLKKAHGDSNIGKENNEVNEHNTGKMTVSEHSESVDDKCRIPGDKSGPKLSESVEDKCHKAGEKNGPSNPALEDKGNKNEVDDELPHGWTLELRTRKYRGGTKRDPYYTDPVSGYIFRSRKDVWRYLETGDIRKCASRPQKRNTNESPSTGNAKKKEEHSASTSQLSAADMAEKESDISKEKEADCHKSEENSLTKNEGLKQESKLVDDNGVSSSHNGTAPSRKSKRKSPNVPQRSSKRLAGNNRNVNEPTLSAAVKEATQQLDTDSNVQKITTVPIDTNALFNDEAVNEVPPQQLDTNIYTESSNPAVIEVPPQQLDTKSSNEEMLLPQQHDANMYTKSINAAVNEVPPQQLDAVVNEFPDEFVTNLDATGGTSSVTASQTRIEMDLNSTLELLFEDMDVQQQQTSLGQENETQKEADPKFQGDYWSDSCFDFAFKTLAEEMPFGETIELDTNAPPPSFFQNNETYNSDPVPENPTSQSVKASLPGSSASDSQKP